MTILYFYHNILYIFAISFCVSINIYYAHLASLRFEHSVCRWSLMTTYITLLALLVEHSLVHWYQQCVTVHQMPKCINCHKAIVVITRRAHSFHDCVYINRVHITALIPFATIYSISILVHNSNSTSVFFKLFVCLKISINLMKVYKKL